MKALLMQVFQTAASVLQHRLPHSAKPHPRILPQRGIEMKIIVAVDSNWAIGNKGDLLVSIPEDHKRFRKETMGKVVVYGRKTLETFPMKQPLDKRTNIILSGNPNLSVRGAEVCHSIDELLGRIKEFNPDDVYIIGGASVYRQMLPYTDTCIVTKLDRAYAADAYFPNLDEDPDWEITEESDEQVYFDTTYEFVTYKRK